MRFEDRAAVLLKAADLLAGPWRATVNAATMLGQSKTAFQAEIDSACELIDFWRFNVLFAEQLYREQPAPAPLTWNRMDHRPLEGFIYAITPFNFTAIGGNLPTAPALMGNVVVWKPAHTANTTAPAAWARSIAARDARMPAAAISWGSSSPPPNRYTSSESGIGAPACTSTSSAGMPRQRHRWTSTTALPRSP